MKNEVIFKLLRSESYDDVYLGYQYLIRKYKKLWIARKFLPRYITVNNYIHYNPSIKRTVQVGIGTHHNAMWTYTYIYL